MDMAVKWFLLAVLAVIAVLIWTDED